MEKKQTETLETILKDLPGTTYEQWMDRIKLDLKGKAVEDLNWSLDQQLTTSPFASKKSNASIATTGLANQIQWENGAVFSISDAHANDSILTSLVGGCENILLQNCSQDHDPTQVLENVQLQMVGVHFLDVKEKKLSDCIHALHQLCKNQGLNPDQMKGSIRCQFSKDSPEASVTNWHRTVKTTFPTLKSINIILEAPDASAPRWIEESTQCLNKFVQLLSKIPDSETKEILESTAITIHSSNQYILEMVRIRSLKLVWQNILAAAGCSTDQNAFEVIIKPSKQNMSKEAFMIESSAMVLASVFGGAHRVIVQPALEAGSTSENELKMRVALNVHHLLKYESYLENYADPLVGSYFFEQTIGEASKLIWESVLK